MSSLWVFVQGCPNCKWRSEINTIKAFAQSQGMGVSTRRTDMSHDHRIEAQELGVALPFVYNPETNKSIRLIGISEAEMDSLL